MSGPPPKSEPGQDARSRRLSGPRIPISEPVVVLEGPRRYSGWILNLSRGGLRAALEEKPQNDVVVRVFMGDEEQARGHEGRIVWVRGGQDGAIVGIAFTTPLPEAMMPESGDDLSRTSDVLSLSDFD